jgi:uncharacterized membrane protein
MQYYLLLKYIHIISATILFGTGIGTAFFMLFAYLSKNISALKFTASHVVLADWIFTTPAVILQPMTGVMLMFILNYSFNSIWFALVMGLYLLAGLSWVRVVFMQYQMRNMVLSLSEGQPLPLTYHHLMRGWIILGCIAFTAIIIIFWLMTFKMGMNAPLL